MLCEPNAMTKILCVGRRGLRTEIYECDADGQRLRPITSDAKLCLSPNWNPGRYSFYYTSWITGLPCVYVASPEMNHSWNAVLYKGEVRYIDLTARHFSKITASRYFDIMDISDAVMGIFDWQQL